MANERLSKREYFTQRLNQAIENNKLDKVKYYSYRLAQLDEKEKNEHDLIEIPLVEMFGSRDTIREAIKYAESFKDIGTTTSAFVLLNTIADKYYLVEK